jgi:hypothetical protein
MDLERPVPQTMAGMAGMAEAGTSDSRNDGQSKYERAAAVHEQSDLGCHREHLLPLEAEILKRFGGAAIEPRGPPFIAALGRQVTLGDPRGRTMRGR